MKRWSMLVLVMVMVLLMGCTASEVKLDITASNSTQKLAPGQVIAITLDSNPTTGYGWQVTGETPAIIQQVGDPEYKAGANSAGKVGAGGTQTLRFKALKAGTGTLTLGYMRSFEKGVDPVQTYTLTIEAVAK